MISNIIRICALLWRAANIFMWLIFISTVELKSSQSSSLLFSLQSTKRHICSLFAFLKLQNVSVFSIPFVLGQR